MGDDHGVIIVFVLGLLIGSAIGLYLGDSLGKRSVHSGAYACQTLPDKTVHCWKVQK